MSRCPATTSSWLFLILTSFLAANCRAARLFPITSNVDFATGVLPFLTSAPVSNQTSEEDDQSSQNVTRCEDAKLRCAYRTGCGNALTHYLSRCAAVLHGDVRECPEDCQHALIALMSTDEGKELMTCNCSKGDTLCNVHMRHVEICRAPVLMAMKRPRVSCRVAEWICHADALCSTALSYYNENCKRMFHGKKCTKRCRNSISILRRQEKAAKLNTCFCDGSEPYDCPGIHRNMDALCFNKPTQNKQYEEHQLGAGSPDSGHGSSGNTWNNRVTNGTSAGASASWRILLLGLVLLLHCATR